MERIRGYFQERFGKKKIYQQILFSMVSVSIVTMGILGLVIFSISKKTLEDRYQRSHGANLRITSEIIDMKCKNVVDLGRTLLENKMFIQAFTREQGEGRFFGSRDQQIIDRIVGEMINSNFLIRGALVINKEGQWRYCAKQSRFSGYLNHYYTTDDLLMEDWVEAAGQAKGKEVFYGYDVLLGDMAPGNFSFVKSLINPENQEPMGYMIMSIDTRLLEDAFGKDREGYESNSYLMTKESFEGGDREVMYISGDGSGIEEIIREYSLVPGAGAYLFTEYKNDITGWNLVNAIKKSEFKKDSNYIGRAVLLAMFLLVALSAVLARYLSGKISRPLQILESTIQNVGEGSRRVEEEFDDSEIGRIGNQFKDMVNNNLELRERLLTTEITEREARLQLLQSQINPHFLYNTLDSLYFMAIIEEADDIADMVSALSNTFKLSLNRGDKLILVRDEIAYIRDYLKIQNFRYHDRFQVVIDVEEEILEERILTFLLQPVVENAIGHGLEPKLGEGALTITGYREENMLCFTVEDDGVGVENLEVLEGGYGIRNIQERIRLFYGEEYRAVFESSPGNGTSVTLKFPVIRGEGERIYA